MAWCNGPPSGARSMACRLKANRSATRCRLDIGKNFQISRLSPAAHEEFITKGCQMVIARPSPYSLASVLTRQAPPFRPDI